MKRKPSRLPGAFAVVVCAALCAWLGWCAVLVAQCARDAYACKACVETGGTWARGACEVPAVNIQIVPRGPAGADAPAPGTAL